MNLKQEHVASAASKAIHAGKNQNLGNAIDLEKAYSRAAGPTTR